MGQSVTADVTAGCRGLPQGDAKTCWREQMRKQREEWAGMTGRLREHSQVEIQPKHQLVKHRLFGGKQNDAEEGCLTTGCALCLNVGEQRRSAGVSMLQPHRQHHHCEHHQSP